jgi:two-component system chemotaxis response regulator CheY
MSKIIMAADDSASMRQLISFILQKAGYEVVEAVDGLDAITQLRGRSVDMLLTDLNMPSVDGIELIRRVRALDSHRFIPIIMLTTESAPEKRMAGKEAGATGWIVKPFQPEQLLAVVQKVLR